VFDGGTYEADHCLAASLSRRCLIDAVELCDVRTIFVMERMKQTTALPLHYLDVV